jgi:hypothetical protein
LPTETETFSGMVMGNLPIRDIVNPPCD